LPRTRCILCAFNPTPNRRLQLTRCQLSAPLQQPAPISPAPALNPSLGQHICANSDKLFLWPAATALSKSWQWPQSVAGWPITVQKCNFTFSINKHLATDSGQGYGGRGGGARRDGAARSRGTGLEGSRVVYFTFAAA